MEQIKEYNWIATAERYKAIINEQRDLFKEDSFEMLVLNNMEDCITELFEVYEKKAFNLDQVQEDLRYRIKNASDNVSHQVYLNIWNLTDARTIAIVEE